MENYHIKKTATFWALTREGAAHPSKTARTKEELVALAQQFLQHKTASLKIHKEDGALEEERTYPRSADPSQTPG